MALTTRLAKQLQTERWAKILPSMIDAAERDPAIAKLHTRLHAGYLASFHEAIQRGKENGQLAVDSKSSEIVATIVRPLFYRRWISREPLDEPLVKTVVNNAVAEVKR